MLIKTTYRKRKKKIRPLTVLLLILLLGVFLFVITGCSLKANRSGEYELEKSYVYVVSVSSDDVSEETEEIEYKGHYINKKYGVDFDQNAITLNAMVDGLTTIVTITNDDLGLPLADFSVDFIHTAKEVQDVKNYGYLSYLGGADTNFEGIGKLIETDYALGVHIPQQENHGVVVAVIGTGVRTNAVGLAHANYWENTDETLIADGQDTDGNGYVDDRYGWDFGLEEPMQKDFLYTSPHETEVAGMIVSNFVQYGLRGVNPDATIMSLKVKTDEGPYDKEGIALSIRYFVENHLGKGIINMSFGTGDPNDVIKEAIAYAFENDILMFSSTGNDGKKDGLPPSSYVDHVFAVTGLSEDETKRHTEASWVDGVHFAAPYYRLHTFWQSVYSSGTSLSSPIVAGIASLVWGNNPNLTREQVMQKIIEHTIQLSDPDQTGYGRIDVRSLVMSYVDMHTKTVKADIDQDGRMEQLKIQLSTDKFTGKLNKGFVTHMVDDDGTQYTIQREF